MQRVLVWDLAVRMFHWLLVAGFIGAFALAELTDDDGPVFVIHMVLGLLVGGMTLLRILWGWVGSRYARFSAFNFSPGALLAYFRSLAVPGGTLFVGHNPATSYAALGMLAAALGLVATGLGMNLGYGEALKEVHEALAFGLLVVAGVHVVGVVLHAVRHRDGIALSMLDGKKMAPQEASIGSSRPVAAAVGLTVTGLAAVGLLSGYDGETGRVALGGTGIVLGGASDEQGDDHDATEKRDADRDGHGNHDGRHHQREHHDEDD